MTHANATDLPTIEQQELKLMVRIEPGEYCPVEVTGPEFEIREIRTQPADGEFRCELVMEAPAVKDGRTLVAHKEEVDCECPCSVFLEYDCIPNVTSVGDDGFLVEGYLAGRDRIRELIADLEARCEQLEVLQLTTNDLGGVDERLAEVDMASLTDKQQSALRSAIAEGYYDTEVQVTLADLVEDLDISRQAFAQRLAAAEQKVMSQLRLLS